MIPVRFRFSTNFLESRFWNKHDQTLLELSKISNIDLYRIWNFDPRFSVSAMNFSVGTYENTERIENKVRSKFYHLWNRCTTDFFVGIKFGGRNGTKRSWIENLQCTNVLIWKRLDFETGPKNHAPWSMPEYKPYFLGRVDIIDFKSDILINFRNLKDHKD